MDEAELPYETYWILTAHICCYVGAQILLTVTLQNVVVLGDFKLTMFNIRQYLARNNKNPDIKQEGPRKDDQVF